MLLCDQSDSKIETKKKKKKHELFWVCLALKGWKISFVIPFIVCIFFFQVKRRSILSCDRREGETETSKQKKTTTTEIILDFF